MKMDANHVTKYILEEDDDRIPLNDIEVGEAGMPHLITHHPGEHLDAPGETEEKRW